MINRFDFKHKMFFGIMDFQDFVARVKCQNSFGFSFPPVFCSSGVELQTSNVACQNVLEHEVTAFPILFSMFICVLVKMSLARAVVVPLVTPRRISKASDMQTFSILNQYEGF